MTSLVVHPVVACFSAGFPLVDPKLTTAHGHAIDEYSRHDLVHAIPNYAEIGLRVEPWSGSKDMPHAPSADHTRAVE